jgi:hypothetical protein
MDSVEEWAQEMMREVCGFWRELVQEGSDLASGVAVFYGPVRRRPEVMVIGINPGGGPASFDRARCQVIPRIHEYVTYEQCSSDPIAGRMCALFRRIDRFELLERSVKLNLNFFRTPGEADWNQVPRQLRQRIRAFCDEKVDRIIAYLAPRVILAEGLIFFSPISSDSGGQCLLLRVCSPSRTHAGSPHAGSYPWRTHHRPRSTLRS